MGARTLVSSVPCLFLSDCLVVPVLADWRRSGPHDIEYSGRNAVEQKILTGYAIGFSSNSRATKVESR
jgi:hypothetical protein